MNYLGSDFNSSGSVMAKAELTVARTKRGECVTCGRRCFRKKFFKMIPLDESGKVLNGRCLNCKPLQLKDVSIVSSRRNTYSQTSGRSPSSRGNRSIISSNSSVSVAESHRMITDKKKKSFSEMHYQPRSQLLKSHSTKGVNDERRPSTKGQLKYPLDRAMSTPPSTSRTRSAVGRITVHNQLSTRPSLASYSARAARNNTGSTSTLSIGSISSLKITSNRTSKDFNSFSSDRSLAIAENFGSTTKNPEISWIPPPHHQEFRNIYDEKCDDGDTKFKSEDSLNSSLIESVQNPDVEPIQAFLKICDQVQDIEQHLSIAESNVSFTKTVSVAEEDDHMQSIHSRKRGTLNRGGSIIQPRSANEHGRPSIGTLVLAGSTRTMSSMSTIGEDDHLLTQNTFEKKNFQLPRDRQNLHRMGSFVRYCEGSSQTLGSLSTIDVINEEGTKGMSFPEDMTSEFFPVVDRPKPLLVPPVPPQEQMSRASNVCCDERKEPPSYYQEETSSSNLRTVTIDNFPTEQDEESRSNYVDEVSSNYVCAMQQGGELHITRNTLKELLISLEKVSASSELTEKKLTALSEFTSFGDTEDILTGIKTVVTCMQSHAAVFNVQLWGCRAIWNMISSSDEDRNVVIRGDISGTITKAMKQLLEIGEDFQEEAIRVLSHFADNRSNVDFLVTKGDDAVDAIVMAMEYYPKHIGIQMRGCQAFSVLASHNNSTLRLRMIDKGAGEAILFNALAIHPEDFSVQESALFAVRNLIIDSEEIQNRLLDLGVVDPILSAMKKHGTIAGLQAAGAGVISILAGNNAETKKVIKENGGIKLVLRALFDHSCHSKDEQETYIRTLLTLSLDSYDDNNSESRNSNRNAKAAEAVSAVIDAINKPCEKANHPKLALAIDAIILVMEAHEDISAVQEVGCTMLGCLANMIGEGIETKTDQTKIDIVDGGALDAINMAMVIHRHEVGVQEQACSLLLVLGIEENYAAINAAIGIQLLEDAAKNFPSRCRAIANKLIQLLIEDEGQNDD